MDLKAYLDRIDYRGDVRPDMGTLRALHRAHLFAIPYENLDVQFGRPVTLDTAAAFDKIVTRGRGGWCYEMNALFGAVLQEVGFNVTPLAGAAKREVLGNAALGSHFIVSVDMGEPWIADVGFGDGASEPFPVKAGPFAAGGFQFRLEPLDDGWWRFHNHELGGASSYDFELEPADHEVLKHRCGVLQTAPDSGFVLNMVVQRFNRDGTIVQLRGRTYRRIRPSGKEERVLGSADELVDVLAREFALDLPEAAELWPRIVARHNELFVRPDGPQHSRPGQSTR